MADLSLSNANQLRCVCHPLHENICDPRTCHEASISRHSAQPNVLPSEDKIIYLSDFKIGAVNGCSCCKILYDGLLLPEVKSVWRMDGLGDEKVRILLVNTNSEGRVILRVEDVASCDYLPIDKWRFFAFNSQSDFTTEPMLCRAFPSTIHHLSEHTSSENSWRNLKQWIEICDKDHEGCRRGTYAPSRVVDLGFDQEKVRSTICVLTEVYLKRSSSWGS